MVQQFRDGLPAMEKKRPRRRGSGKSGDPSSPCPHDQFLQQRAGLQALRLVFKGVRGAARHRCHNAIPEFAIRKEAAEAVTVHERRIADLTRLKSEGGGFGLSEDAGTVIAERAKLERAVAERDRQQALYEVVAANLGQKLF
jgi:hypothetical protein